MKSNAKWLIANFHTYSYNQVIIVKEKILELLNSTTINFETYYYASYINNQNEDFDNHFKVHILNSVDERKMKYEFEKIKNENNELISNLTYDEVGGNPTSIDGVNDRLLACYGREIKDLLANKTGKKLTSPQMQMILHYMFNQMDYGYVDEINVYLPLIERYSKKLPQNIKEQIKKILQDSSKTDIQ